MASCNLVKWAGKPRLCFIDVAEDSHSRGSFRQGEGCNGPNCAGDLFICHNHRQTNVARGGIAVHFHRRSNRFFWNIFYGAQIVEIARQTVRTKQMFQRKIVPSRIRLASR